MRFLEGASPKAGPASLANPSLKKRPVFLKNVGRRNFVDTQDDIPERVVHQRIRLNIKK
jgi:hypothetical protein